MFPTKRTNRMLMTMSTVIAFPGTWNLLSAPSCLIVIPSRRDAVERATAVRRRGVHGDQEARDETDDEQVLHELGVRPEDREHPADVVVARDRLLARPADERDRQQDVDEEREERRRAQGELRVADGVLVLGGERRADVDPPGRPAHQPQPDQGELEPTPGQPVVVELVDEVVAVESPPYERPDHHDEQRDHQQRAGQVAERHADARAVHVEEPDGEDQPDRDQLRQPDVVRPSVEKYPSPAR